MCVCWREGGKEGKGRESASERASEPKSERERQAPVLSVTKQHRLQQIGNHSPPSICQPLSISAAIRRRMPSICRARALKRPSPRGHNLLNRASVLNRTAHGVPLSQRMCVRLYQAAVARLMTRNRTAHKFMAGTEHWLILRRGEPDPRLNRTTNVEVTARGGPIRGKGPEPDSASRRRRARAAGLPPAPQGRRRSHANRTARTAGGHNVGCQYFAKQTARSRRREADGTRRTSLACRA